MYSCRIFYDNSRHRLRHRPSPRNTNSLKHWPSPTMRRLVSHSTHGSRQLCKFVAPGLRASNVLSIFQFLTLGGLPLGPRSPKREMTYYPPRSTILQNFSPIAQTVYEICVTKVFSLFGPWGLTPGPNMTWWTPRSTSLQNFITLRQPTPEISLTKNPADTHTHKKTNSKQYIHNMPIGMCG